MAIWATFDESVQLEQLQAAARRQHISLEDAGRWWTSHRAIRFGFASLDEAEMERVRAAFGGGTTKDTKGTKF